MAKNPTIKSAKAPAPIPAFQPAILSPASASGQTFWPQADTITRACRELLPRVLVLTTLAIVVTSFHVYSWRNYEGPKRAFLFYGCMVAVGLCYLAGAKYREHFVSPIGLPVQLLVFMAGMSTVFAANLSEGLEDLTEFVFKFALMFLVMRYARTWYDARRQLFLMVFLGLGCGIYGLCQYYQIGGSDFTFTRQPVSTLGNINYAAELYNVCLFCTVPMLLYSLGRRNPGATVLCTLALVVMCWTLVHIDSRASHVGILAAIAVVVPATLYYRGMGRLLSPSGFRFNQGTAVVLLVLLFPALALILIAGADRTMNTHTVHGVLRSLTGLEKYFTAKGQNPNEMSARQLASSMESEGAPLANLPMALKLYPVDDIYYAVLFRVALFGSLTLFLWYWLDRRGLLGGHEAGGEPLALRHFAMRLLLLFAGALWLVPITLPTVKFAITIGGGALVVITAVAFAWLFWVGIANRLPQVVCTLPGYGSVGKAEVFFLAGGPLTALGLYLVLRSQLKGTEWLQLITGLLLIVCGAVILTGLLGLWWTAGPGRLARAKPAFIVILLCAVLCGGSVLVYKAATHPFIVETMNGRLPSNVSDVKTILFRFEVYKSTIKTIMDNVLIGIGAGNFKVIHELYTSQIEREVLGKEVLARKVHDTVLSVAVEYGIIGFLAYIWLVAAFYRLCLRLLWFGTRRIDYERTLSFPSRREEAAFYTGLVGLGVMTVVFVNDFFGHTVILPGEAVAYWATIGLVCGIGTTLLSGESRIRERNIPETSPVAVLDQTIPPWSRARYVSLAIIVLLLNLFPLRQFMAEVHLRRGMMVRDYNLYHGKDVTQKRLWGEKSWLAYFVRRYLPFPMEPIYRRFGVFDHYRHTLALFPWQMETYYIFGRYYIDAIQELLDLETEERNVDTERNRRYFENLILRLLYSGALDENDVRAAMRSVGMSKLDDAPTEQWRRLYQALSGVTPDRRREYVQAGLAAHHVDLYMNPNYKWAHNNLGVVTDRNNDSRGSREAYLHALILDPEQVYAHFNLALGYLREGQYAKAAMYFDNAAYTEKQKWDAYRYALQCYIEAGEYDNAFLVAARYLRFLGALEKESADWYAVRQIVGGDPPKELIDAIKDPQEAAKQDPRFGEALYQLGRLYGLLNEDELAERSYAMAVEVDPTNETLLRTYTNRILARARWREALPYLETLLKVIKANPLNTPKDAATTYYELGRAHIFLGSESEGIKNLRQALDLKPQLLAQALKDPGLVRMAEAMSRLRTLLGLN